ncbi:MAG: cytochrome oxidase assembly protein [bacterium]
MKSLRRSRLQLLGVLGAFIVPLVLAMVLYSRLDLWTPPGRVNHGELMEPVGPLSVLALDGENGEAITLDALQGVWTLIYVGKNTCDISCQSNLFKIRQARALLGRDLVRVASLYIALDGEAKESISGLHGQYPNLKVGQVAPEASKAQEDAFGSAPEGKFFLIDPHGNLVLRYDDDATTKGLLKDLKRLLKVSQIG